MSEISKDEKEKYGSYLNSHRIIEQFQEKSDENRMYFSYLCDIAAYAAPILSRIIIHFPMYTPHDFTQHSYNLFEIADSFLSDSMKEKMTNCSLFCLLSSLLLHDVGMAISDEEFESIGNDPDFMRFYDDIKGEFGSNVDIVNAKREWIRDNHHKRSYKRTLKIFQDMGIPEYGEAVSLIVRGHGIHVQEINNNDIDYSRSFPIGQNKLVDIKALTMYLRILDLLDCTRTRTPITLFDFINISNETSREEWQRHLSILSITKDHNLNKLVGKARTSDPRIYRKLNKYTEWFNEEIRDARSILTDSEDYYQLDVNQIDIDIKTDGFEPVQWEFKLNRSAILELLTGNNLYSNPSTCVRELLQNAVDACRQRKLVDVGYIPNIQIRLCEFYGHLYLECTDNGVGMTSEVIERFLLNVGQRYYESEYYKKIFREERKRIDPVARFGIGFLSVFMVADNVAITTNHFEKNEHPIVIEFNHPADPVIKRKGDLSTPLGTKVLLKIERIIKNDFDLVNCVKNFVGLLEMPIFVSDLKNNDVEVQILGTTQKEDDVTVTFSETEGSDIKGYLEKDESNSVIYAHNNNIISQLGFRISTKSLIPKWANNIREVIDISGALSFELSTSRESVIPDEDKMQLISNIAAKQLINKIWSVSHIENNEFDKTSKGWKLLKHHIDIEIFIKNAESQEKDKLKESLYLIGYVGKEKRTVNLKYLEQHNMKITITPTPIWRDEEICMKEENYPTNGIFCLGKENGYDYLMHKTISLLLNCPGMPIWIEEANSHVWEYIPNNSEQGVVSIQELCYDAEASNNDSEISYEVDESIVVSYGNSPFLLFECPFDKTVYLLNASLYKEIAHKETMENAYHEAIDIADEYLERLREAIDDDMTSKCPVDNYGYGFIRISHGDYEVENEMVREIIERTLRSWSIEFDPDSIII